MPKDNSLSRENLRKAAERNFKAEAAITNGGGSIVDFFEALGEYGTKIAKVPLVVSFPKREE